VIPGFVWVLPARILDWHDGDTCHADVAWPAGVMKPDWPVRLLRLYCPELDQAGGAEALAYAAGAAPAGTLVRLVCKPLGPSGRWTSTQESLSRLLASVTLPGGGDLSALVVGAGLGWATHVPGSGEGIVGIDRHPGLL
jgi:endonuclease YncB( thermonuclease family)